MKFFGFNITKAADPGGISSRSQMLYSAPNQVQLAFNNWILRKVDPKFYENLREAIPMNETAIDKLISLNGRIEIIGDKEDCVKELEDFCMSVPVGPVQHGIDSYRRAMWNEGEEQGFALGELCATEDLKDIEGLRIADSKYIIYWRNSDGVPEPWYLYPDKDRIANRPLIDPAELIGRIVNASYGTALNYNQQDMVKLNPANKFYLAPRIENSSPYGISLFRAQPWVAQILATFQTSMKNSADRFGDPIYHGHASNKGGVAAVQKALDDLSTQLTNALTVKRQGGSADIVTSGGEASTVKIEVIGHDGQLFEYEKPLRHVEEQIVASSRLPGWMLSKYWSTTERMAQLEVEVALADASGRNTNETPGLIRLFSAVLAMRGKKWKTITTDIKKPGDWGFRFIQPNLHNLVAEAQANFLNSQADMMRRGSTGGSADAPAASVRNDNTEVPVGSASFEIEDMKFQVPIATEKLKALTAEGAEGEGRGKCICGKVHSELRTLNPELVKELNRPIPWPKLDEIEADYEKDLKADWALLQKKVFDILNLTLPESSPSSATSKPALSKVEGSSAVKDVKAFAFGDNERKRIMDALKEYLGWNDPLDPDGTVRWSYMQSYSSGLIKAAQLVGKERPLLDILKNSEIFNELATSGFRLVKDNATIAITDRIIPALESFTVQGMNPRDAARELDWQFGDQNSNWERLARTEMNGAAQQAKRDEWDARGIDTSNYINGPRDLHPRCKCDSTVEQRDGKWYMVFMPAPDACEACKAAAEGSKMHGQGFSSKSHHSHPESEPRNQNQDPALISSLEKIADRPINIKSDINLHISQTGGKKKFEIKDKDGKVVRTGELESD